jgi:hypothetical protein
MKKTILRADLHYTMKNVFFELMNTLVVKKMNTGNEDTLLAGHKKCIETGERVLEDTALELEKVVQLN